MSIKRTGRTRRRKSQNSHLNTDKDSILTSPDTKLMILTAILTVFGTMAILSAGAPEGGFAYQNPAYFAMKHLVFLVIGLVGMVAAAKTDFRFWKDNAIIFSICTILLIGATLVPGLGRIGYGSSRWLVFLPIQPSELAKLAAIFLASTAIIESKNIFNNKLLTHLSLIIAMMYLLLKQPNLSIAVIIFMITGALLFISGLSYIVIGIAAALGSVGAYFIIMHNPYQLSRITGWLNPWADPQGTGYNLIQSWYAIGSGGLFGVGFGHSLQKKFWLPFGHTDFIFAVIAEEWGLIGCIILIGIFIAFINRGFTIARRCPDPFGRLLAFGITFSIGFQALINIGVATGVLPVTGVTLPLISYGGSSVVVTLVMIGILLNVSRQRIKKIPNQELDYDY